MPRSQRATFTEHSFLKQFYQTFALRSKQDSLKNTLVVTDHQPGNGRNQQSYQDISALNIPVLFHKVSSVRWIEDIGQKICGVKKCGALPG